MIQTFTAKSLPRELLDFHLPSHEKKLFFYLTNIILVPGIMLSLNLIHLLCVPPSLQQKKKETSVIGRTLLGLIGQLVSFPNQVGRVCNRSMWCEWQNAGDFVCVSDLNNLCSIVKSLAASLVQLCHITEYSLFAWPPTHITMWRHSWQALWRVYIYICIIYIYMCVSWVSIAVFLLLCEHMSRPICNFGRSENLDLAGLNPGRNQPNDFQIDTCCFLARHSALLE